MKDPLKINMHVDVSKNELVKFKTEEGREQSEEAKIWLTKALKKPSTLVRQVYSELRPLRNEKYPDLHPDDQRRAF